MSHGENEVTSQWPRQHAGQDAGHRTAMEIESKKAEEEGSDETASRATSPSRPLFSPPPPPLPSQEPAASPASTWGSDLSTFPKVKTSCLEISDPL